VGTVGTSRTLLLEHIGYKQFFRTLVRYRVVSCGGNGIAAVPRVAAMKVALLLAAHERRNIFPHYGMKVFSDNSCGLFTLSPRLDKG
jgi:hypothetical protein